MEVPEISDFISQLASLIEYDFGNLYPHITIFTKGSKDGIGIYNETEFKKHLVEEIYN